MTCCVHTYLLTYSSYSHWVHIVSLSSRVEAKLAASVHNMANGWRNPGVHTIPHRSGTSFEMPMPEELEGMDTNLLDLLLAEFWTLENPKCLMFLQGEPPSRKEIVSYFMKYQGIWSWWRFADLLKALLTGNQGFEPSNQEAKFLGEVWSQLGDNLAKSICFQTPKTRILGLCLLKYPLL